MKLIAIITLIFASIFAKNENTILSIYNPTETITSLHNDLDFWNQKLDKSPAIGLYNLQVSQIHTSLFDKTGDIKHLKKAENLLRNTIQLDGLEKSNALLALSQNLVTQHRFCEAYDMILEASAIGKDMRKVNLVMYDIESELGIENEVLLDKLSEKYDIQYIIRKAKSEDANGNLNKAILLLENAQSRALLANNKALLIWTSTNLAEFYGHKGQIAKSRKLLEQVIAIDNSNWYAMKLLAWIAYAADSDYDLAEEYINKIKKYRICPDADLLLHQINLSKDLQSNLDQQFLQNVNNDLYGVMYNTYKIEILLNGSISQKAIALEIAKKEVNNRATPESYDLLAYALFINGFENEAKFISKNNVLGLTEEPKVLFHQLIIYNQQKDIKNHLLNSLEGSEFELGPIVTKKIKSL
jgi:hypothetical protein